MVPPFGLTAGIGSVRGCPSAANSAATAPASGTKLVEPGSEAVVWARLGERTGPPVLNVGGADGTLVGAVLARSAER